MTDLISNPDQQMIPAPQDPPAPSIDDATKELLKRYGFDHVPTVEELRARKAQRQAEVRAEVLFQADRRNWCEDGTRTVCANLRLQRPGSREQRTIRATVSYEVELKVHSWTDKGSLTAAMHHNYLPTEAQNTRNRAFSNITLANVTVNDQAIEWTDDLAKELMPNVSE